MFFVVVKLQSCGKSNQKNDNKIFSSWLAPTHLEGGFAIKFRSWLSRSFTFNGERRFERRPGARVLKCKVKGKGGVGPHRTESVSTFSLPTADAIVKRRSSCRIAVAFRFYASIIFWLTKKSFFDFSSCSIHNLVITVRILET